MSCRLRAITVTCFHWAGKIPRMCLENSPGPPWTNYTTKMEKSCNHFWLRPKLLQRLILHNFPLFSIIFLVFFYLIYHFFELLIIEIFTESLMSHFQVTIRILSQRRDIVEILLSNI